MVVRIRLARHGQRHRAFYRIVSADSRAKRDGRFLEVLGFYDPLPHSAQEGAAGIKRVALNVPRIKYWLSVGAQPSDTVGRLLGASGLLGSHPRSFRDPPASSLGKTDTVVTDDTTGALKPTNPASRGIADALGSLDFSGQRASGITQRDQLAL